MEAAQSYLDSSKKQFLYYKTLADKAMLQLDPLQLFYTPNDDTNSIALVVKHMVGNMLSRWTDFLTTDGEKEWRNRDDEFQDPYSDVETMTLEWEKAWKVLFDALNTVNAENLNAVIYIRNEGHTVIEAINRQLAHYPYHVGQIVFFAKMLKQSGWQSLSIPKNNSVQYNSDKFAQEKQTRNFTDAELNRLNDLR
jgi:hypothetical protein